MISSYKLSLIQLHLITSLLWNYFIIIIEQSRHVLVISFLCFLIIYFDQWPNSTYLKNFFLLLFILINSFFFIKFRKRIEVKISIFRVRQRFQNILNLKNDELLTIIDKPINQEIKKDKEKTYIWNIFKSEALMQIEKNYSFNFKYFFITLNKLSNLTKIMVPLWLIILGFFINTNFINNFYKSINYQTNNILDTMFSTNIWIYPSDSKKKVFFIEKNTNDKTTDIKNLLIDPKSKILINVYDVPRKYLDIVVLKDGTKKILKKSKTLKNTITYEGFIEEGEYQIIIKNKIFQSVNLVFDRRPEINFIDKPTKDKNNFVKFNYNLIDENNLISWLEIFPLETQILNKKYIDYKKINKLGSKSANIILVRKSNQDGVFKRKKEEITFTRNLLNQPLAGHDVNIRLSSIDKTDKIGRSKVYKYNLPKKNFTNVSAKKIIELRKELYLTQDLKRINKELEKISLSLNEKNMFTKKKLTNLIKFTVNKQIDTNIRIEKLLVGTWEAAIFLENNDYESLIDQIRKLKKKLEKLLSNNANEDTINDVVKKLESLLESYLEKENLNKSQNEIFKKDEKEVEKESKLYRDKAKDLLKTLDNILENKEFLDIDIKKMIDVLQNIYKNQVSLIEMIYLQQRDNSANENFLVVQDNIFKDFLKIKKDLIKVLSNEGKLLLFLEDGFNGSLEKIKNKEFSLALKIQKDILINLEKIVNVLKSKARSSQKSEGEESNNSTKGRNQNEEGYDTPIIFEKNLFDEIIEKIRSMTNQKYREDRERDYLRNLLPKY